MPQTGTYASLSPLAMGDGAGHDSFRGSAENHQRHNDRLATLTTGQLHPREGGKVLLANIGIALFRQNVTCLWGFVVKASYLIEFERS